MFTVGHLLGGQMDPLGLCCISARFFGFFAQLSYHYMPPNRSNPYIFALEFITSVQYWCTLAN